MDICISHIPATVIYISLGWTTLFSLSIISSCDLKLEQGWAQDPSGPIRVIPEIIWESLEERHLYSMIAISKDKKRLEPLRGMPKARSSSGVSICLR